MTTFMLRFRNIFTGFLSDAARASGDECCFNGHFISSILSDAYFYYQFLMTKKILTVYCCIVVFGISGFGFLGFWVFGFLGFGFLGFWVFGFLGFGFWVFGFLGFWVLGFGG